MAQARRPPASLKRRPAPARGFVPPRAGGAGGTPDRVVLSHEMIVPRDHPITAPEALAAVTGLAKLRIKDAMEKGAVWIQRGSRKPVRLRHITTPLVGGDRLSIHYDSAILDAQPPAATRIHDGKHYSVWHKPAGLLVEGSRYGDHATLDRQIAEHGEHHEVHLVHRLDMEASGLVVAAHSSGAMAKLSALFVARDVDKRYRIQVRGDLRPRGTSGRIEQALDGKAAVTEWFLEHYDVAAHVSTVQVRMLSGRYHQIRRHFAGIGFPVMGDPRYGQGNKNEDGLKLAAIGIAFKDPWTGDAMCFGECSAL